MQVYFQVYNQPFDEKNFFIFYDVPTLITAFSLSSLSDFFLIQLFAIAQSFFITILCTDFCFQEIAGYSWISSNCKIMSDTHLAASFLSSNLIIKYDSLNEISLYLVLFSFNFYLFGKLLVDTSFGILRKIFRFCKFFYFIDI